METLNGSSVTIQGVNDWSHIQILKGTTGIVIDQTLAKKFGYKVGGYINLNGQQMTIAGITVKSGGVIYLDINKTLSLIDNKISTISADTNGNPNAISKQIKSQIPEVDALTRSEISEKFGSFISSLLLFTGAIASMRLIIGIISIINTMLTREGRR